MKLLHSLLTPTDRKDRTTQRHQMPQGMELHGTYDSAGIHLPIVKTKNSKRYLHIAIAMLMGTVSTVALADSNCYPNGLTSEQYKVWGYGPDYSVKKNATITVGENDLIISGTFEANKNTAILGQSSGFRVDQRASNTNGFSTTTFEFNKPISNLRFSIDDIDASTNGNYWDVIEVIGKAPNGNDIIPEFDYDDTTLKVVDTTNDGKTIRRIQSAKNKAVNFADANRGTAIFNQPITKLIVKYYNTIGTGTQVVAYSFDSFCTGDSSNPDPVDPDPGTSVPIDVPVTCPAGWVKDTFSTNDYQTLASNSGNDPSYSPIGQSSESYIEARIKTSYHELNFLEGTGNTIKLGVESDKRGGKDYITTTQLVNNSSGYSILEYEFRNKFNQQKQEVKNLKVSFYDIDSLKRGGSIYTSGYQDQLIITGIRKDGTTVTPSRLPPMDNKVTGSGSTYYSTTSQMTGAFDRDNQCNPTARRAPLSTDCLLTVSFNEPIASLKVRYDNNTEQYIRTYIGQDIFTHIEGYCYQPQPRLSFSKVLSEARINKDDQFTVKVTEQGSDNAVHDTTHTTTQGEGNTIVTDTGTTGIFKVVPDTIYTLKEEAAGSTDLNNYTATYKCTNADGSEIESSNPLNPKALQMTYGDKWMCTVTNTPKKYVFEGTVFNDNAGIISANPRELNGDYANTDYFNGILDDSEEGIYQNGLKVGLTDCEGHIIEEYSADVSNGSDSKPIGSYRIEVPYHKLSNRNKVCLVEYVDDEDHTPNEMVLKGKAKNGLTSFPVDTTPNSKSVLLSNTPNQLVYDGINFGNVIEDNTALVLIKRQYIYDCNNGTINLQEIAIDDTLLPTQAFSSKGKDELPEDFKIEPNQCVAYRIDAFNRGFIPLSGVSISDPIPANSTLTTPAPTKIGQIKTVAENAGKITTNPNNSNDDLFDLPQRTTATNISNKSQDAIFFNTKYNGN